jgi:hypothetical protein
MSRKSHSHCRYFPFLMIQAAHEEGLKRADRISSFYTEGGTSTENGGDSDVLSSSSLFALTGSPATESDGESPPQRASHVVSMKATEEGVEEVWALGKSSLEKGGTMKTTAASPSLSVSPTPSSSARLTCSTVIKGCWTTAEDKQLGKLVGKHGAVKWSKIASSLPGIWTLTLSLLIFIIIIIIENLLPPFLSIVILTRNVHFYCF